MSNTSFYVRSRGRVTGPFDLSALQTQVRRGALSRIHEVSSDRITWSKAGDFADLFSSPSVRAESLAPETLDVAPTQESVQTQNYFYSQNGQTLGPMPLNVLKSLARNGTLHPNDMCWQDGAQFVARAADLPALAPVYSGGPVSHATGQWPGRDMDPDQARQLLSNIHAFCQVACIVIGAAMLLFLNLPLAIANEKTIWWWTLLHERDSQNSATILFFILLSGIACIAIGATVPGLVRGWIMVGISTISLVLFVVQSILNRTDQTGFLLLLVFPYVAAAMIGVSFFRSNVPANQVARLFQGIIGGVLSFTVTLLLTLILLQDSSAQLTQSFDSNPIPVWVYVALTISLLGLLLGLIGGILGLVGLRKAFSRGVNGTTIGCSLASILLPAISLVIVVVGTEIARESIYPTSGFSSGAVIFLVIRMCLIFLAFPALLSVSLLEVFATSSLGRNRAQATMESTR